MTTPEQPNPWKGVHSFEMKVHTAWSGDQIIAVYHADSVDTALAAERAQHQQGLENARRPRPISLDALWDETGRQRESLPCEHDQGHSLVVWYDDLVDFKQSFEGRIAALTAERDTLQAELTHWKVCANCGEALTAPGICDKAVSEKEKGLELMHEQTLDRAEAAEAQNDRLEQQARDISVLLSDAVCNAMPIPEGVRWLLGRAEAAESTIAAMTAERDKLMAELGEIKAITEPWQNVVHLESYQCVYGRFHYVDQVKRARESERAQTTAELTRLREALKKLDSRCEGQDHPDCECDGCIVRAALASTAPTT